MLYGRGIFVIAFGLSAISPATGLFGELYLFGEIFETLDYWTKNRALGFITLNLEMLILLTISAYTPNIVLSMS